MQNNYNLYPRVATSSLLFKYLLESVPGLSGIQIDRMPANEMLLLLRPENSDLKFATFLKERFCRLAKKMNDPFRFPELEKAATQLTYPDCWAQGYCNLACMDLLRPWCKLSLFPRLACDNILTEYAENTSVTDEDVLVLINTPCLNRMTNGYETADYHYFRTLALTIFFGADKTPMSTISSNYRGYETAADVSKRVKGLIIIDEDWFNGTTICHAFSNPCANNDGGITRASLEEVTELGDFRGGFESFD